MDKIKQFLDNIFEKKTSALSFVFIFLSAIAIRVFIEQFIAKNVPLENYEIAIEFIHNVYFFLISFILIWLFLSLFLKIKPQKLTYFFCWASLFIIFPPIIDMIKTHGEVFWSFYVLGGPKELFSQFVTIFGKFPSGITYFGTKIIFVAAILSIGALVYFITKKIWKGLVSILTIYVILFFMGSFPSIFSFFYYSFFEGKKISQIKDFNVVQLFGSPQNILGLPHLSIKYSFPYNLELIYFPLLIFLLAILFYLASKERIAAVLKNIRPPQLFFHSGLFFVGLGLGYLNYPENFNLSVFSILAILVLLITVWLAWAASVVPNDIYDFEIDKISNPERPLQRKVFNLKEYAELGILLFLLSILGGLTIGFVFAVLLLIYQILAWFYSCPPLRLKKFAGAATFLSSFTLIMVLFLGYVLISSGQSIQTLSWRIILLLVISYTISLPIKDFKDIKGDREYKIWTIPVIFGEKKARLIVAINVFISFMLSVFLLNELRLFWWAALFGILTFLTITSPKTKPRQLFWPVLGLTTVYGLILVKVVFL